ncbi:helix-turn-helix domain-containing protein [Paracoccus pantotrophus]|uniref:helix-turn-helix domain-containing protein n=1 Tax=Paracoccus pantotrophus TaxID=82367 RepID=UPI0004AD6CBC|nr:helix-turn-helix domain-containing protein [Paracoccus pantotrophus]
MKKQPALDWHGIKAELHRRGMTLTELAKRNGMDPSTCRKVGSRTHFGAQAAIASFIDRKPEDLWPDRYPQGKPSILDTTKFPPVASQKGNATADSRKVA